MSHFPGFDASDEVLECMRRNSEGKFHRHRTREMEEFFEKVIFVMTLMTTNGICSEYKKKPYHRGIKDN